MSSTNFTTHYGIPTPLGTDLTTPMDYNIAAEAVDTALFGAVTDAANASQSAQEAISDVASISDTVSSIQTDLTQEKAKIVSLQTRMTSAENEIDDVRADSSDMITAYNEPTATSTHAYAIGDFFIYNNTLYKATAAIAIGDTIVPDTNCTTTNVSSEIIQLNASLTNLPVIRREFQHSIGVTIAAGSYEVFHIDTYVRPNGYYPIAVLAVDSGNTHITIEGFNAMNNYYRLHNCFTENRVAQPKVTILFIAEEFIAE